MAAHTSLAYLRVNRHDRADGSVEYTYLIPGHRPYTEERTAQSRDALNSQLSNAAAELRPLPAGVVSFADLGDALTDRYIPQPVRAYLFAEDTPLLIETNDPEFPWEVLRHHDVPLGVIRPVGRTLRLNLRRSAYEWGTRRRALLVGNPTGTLSATEQEVHDLQSLLEGYVHPYAVEDPLLLGARATAGALKKALQEHFELFHFAGHVEYDKQHKGGSGLSCARGVVLGADDIRRLPTDFAYVFINGCEGAQAAQTQDPALQSLAVSGIAVNGLATAFLARGARAFISALWPIFDASAAAFSRSFYEQILRGVCFGDALRWVRAQWLQQHPHEPTWAGYVLYGNPLLTLDSVRDPVQEGREAMAAFERAHDSVYLASLADLPRELREQRVAAPFSEDRTERFFRRFVADPTVALSSPATDAISRTLAWVEYAKWDVVARLDLLVGLALVPGGMVARGLATLGFSPEQVREINLKVFRTGHGTAEQPDVSSGVFTVFARAARFARRAARTLISEDDLAAALLDVDGTGSLQAGMELLGIEPRTLLAAARGRIVAERPPSPSVAPPHSHVLTTVREQGPKRDTTPHKLLRDLRAAAEETMARAGGASSLSLPPFVGRGKELRDVLAILTRPRFPHVVLRALDGAGGYALAQALAVRVVTEGTRSFETAPIAGWDIFAVRVAREDERVGEWLAEDLDRQLEIETLLVLHDLPRLLRFDGVAQTLMRLARHPMLRLLATVRPEEYLAIRSQDSALVSVFTPIDLAPPSPERALPMVEAHAARLARDYRVAIAPDAAAVAVSLAREEAPLVLPGAAIERLERACIRVRDRAFPTSAPLAAVPASASPASPAPSSTPQAPATAEGAMPGAGGAALPRQQPAQPTLGETPPPTISADDVRAARPGR